MYQVHCETGNNSYFNALIYDYMVVRTLSLDISQMREKIADAYDGDGWKKKVRFMPDDQVIAIFYRMKKKGQIKDAG